MHINELKALVDSLPRKRIGFYPTPFHKLENLSRKYEVNFFIKREDMSGPGILSGSKTRLAEFIIGQALEDGVTHLITQGLYLTNSGCQFAVASRAAGITPIIYLTRDVSRHGPLDEYRGNLLLTELTGAEIHVLPVSGAYWDTAEAKNRLDNLMGERKAQLEADGHKALIVPTGGAHPFGFIGHALTFAEMLEQSKGAGVQLDYIYHTAGTGTALPGLLTAKLLTGSRIQFRSISICPYRPDYWMNKNVIVDRVHQIFRKLRLDPPSHEEVLNEIDVDERFIGEGYAIPSPESIAAIRELAQADGVFVGPVYTGKGFAGLLDHVRTGKIKKGSNVGFLHTGDAGNLFEIPEVVGKLMADPAPVDPS